MKNRPQQSFFVQALPPFQKTGRETTAEQLVRVSRERYGRDRHAVERVLTRFLSPYGNTCYALTTVWYEKYRFVRRICG
jgi:hypothetical protein